MRYYKKCRDCNGQGKLAKRGSNYHLSISCTCEGGFVDCTSEVEALIRFKSLALPFLKDFDAYCEQGRQSAGLWERLGIEDFSPRVDELLQVLGEKGTGEA